MYSETKRIDYLDSVRGLAALFVLNSHCISLFVWPPLLGHLINLPLVQILFDGKAAVAMFFVLSGFVLSRPYLVADEAGRPPRKILPLTFYLRRFTRIWLPWLAAWCVSALAQQFLFHPPATTPPFSAWGDQLWHHFPTWKTFLQQCVFILHDKEFQLLTQDWSLGIELKGSALIPIFILLVAGWRLLGLSLLGLVLLLGLNAGHCYVSFILGVLLAKYAGKIIPFLRRQPAGLIFILGVAAMALYETRLYCLYFSSYLFIHGEKFIWICTSAGCVGLLILCISSNCLQRILQHQWLVFTGKISYSLYLFQLVVILCLLPGLVAELNRLGIYQTRFLFPLTLLAGVLATLALSALTYWVFERPSIRLGHFLTVYFQSKFFNKKTKV